MKNIISLINLGAEVVVNTVLTKNIIPHLEVYLKDIKDSGIEVLQLSKFYPLGEGEINKTLMPSPNQFEDIMKFLLAYSKRNKLKIVFDHNFSFLIDNKKKNIVSRKCSGGISKLIIETNGDCFPCQLLPLEEFNMGNILTDSLNTIWNSKAKNKFIEDFFPEDCRDCKHNKYCNGGCKATSYSISKTFKYKDPYCFAWETP